jgi:hypothetical protein
MNEQDIDTLRANDHGLVKITTWDGEILIAKVLFVSEPNQDLSYDFVSTSKESQYAKNDEQAAYLIRFADIKSIEAAPKPS